MAHALSSYRTLSHLDAATVADYPLVANALVFAAITLVVALGSEYLFTKQAIFFRTLGTIIDGFRFCHFPKRPVSDGVRRRKPDTDFVYFVYPCISLT
jgi:hypothetical protein